MTWGPCCSVTLWPAGLLGGTGVAPPPLPEARFRVLGDGDGGAPVLVQRAVKDGGGGPPAWGSVGGVCHPFSSALEGEGQRMPRLLRQPSEKRSRPAFRPPLWHSPPVSSEADLPVEHILTGLTENRVSGKASLPAGSRGSQFPLHLSPHVPSSALGDYCHASSRGTISVVECLPVFDLCCVRSSPAPGAADMCPAVPSAKVRNLVS